MKELLSRKVPLNIQLFAEPATGENNPEGTDPAQGGTDRQAPIPDRAVQAEKTRARTIRRRYLRRLNS